jgi:hypothetical protein
MRTMTILDYIAIGFCSLSSCGGKAVQAPLRTKTKSKKVDCFEKVAGLRGGNVCVCYRFAL